ncbi:MAG TPA: LptE family protein [Gemmatimonadaceae bacterium]|nr:LptE family protein [Gemmatimonadaceae bacterium]
MTLVVLLALAGCRWGYGFSGGGLPANIRTVAVLPFDNRTASPDVQRDLTELLRRQVENRLALRDAPPDRADAIVRGTIVRYELDVPVAFSAEPGQATTARRRLALVVDVEIVDQRNDRTLWQRRGLSAEGEYAEGAEGAGRQQALERLVNDVIEGAQSQW